MSFNFAHFNKSTNEGYTGFSKKGGYGDTAMFSAVDKFLVLQNPITSVTPGSSKLIAVAHTFTPPAGFLDFVSKTMTVEIDSDTVGEKEELTWNHVAKVSLLGDSPEMWEAIEELVNTPGIWLFKSPECNASKPYVQLGNACSPATIRKGTLNSRSTKEGSKLYTFEVESVEKFFYNATVTRKA